MHIAYYRVSQKKNRFSKFKNIPDLLSDDIERTIIQNIDFFILAIGRLLWETLYIYVMLNETKNISFLAVLGHPRDLQD